MTGREEAELKRNKAIQKELDNLPDFVSDWHSTMLMKGTQSTTRLDYIKKIRRFINVMEIKDVEDITYATVSKWININAYRSDDPTKETSGAHRQAMWHAMKNFLMFLQDSGMIDDIIKLSLDGKLRLGGNERPKGDNQNELKNRRIIIGEEEFNSILKAIDDEPDRVRRCRDKAIMTLFMTTGMRESALVEMNIEDIDLEALELSYIDKREQYFKRNVDENMINILYDWLNKRKEYVSRSDSPTSALFISREGTRLNANTIARGLKKYSKKALGYEISPHKLRSGFITIMYNHTHDIELVRRIIGHSNVTVTQRYIRVKNDDLENKRQEVLRSIFKNS